MKFKLGDDILADLLTPEKFPETRKLHLATTALDTSLRPMLTEFTFPGKETTHADPNLVALCMYRTGTTDDQFNQVLKDARAVSAESFKFDNVECPNVDMSVFTHSRKPANHHPLKLRISFSALQEAAKKSVNFI